MYYLAIDIGASSGRHIVGWMENGELQQKEVYRFPNGVISVDGSLTWDVEQLFREVKNGIKAAFDGEVHILFTVCPQALAYDSATESLSPDHIVYAKAKQLCLPANADADMIRAAVEGFRQENGYNPRIVFVQGLGMFACGTSETEARTAQIVMLDAIQVVAYAQHFGGVQPMSAFLIDFIVNWEVESNRSKVSLGEKK